MTTITCANDPRNQVRVRNWYLVSLSPTTWLLCGDTLDGKHWKYQQFGLLQVTKIVATGWQCKVRGEEGEYIYNCRWDQSDRYFGSTLKRATLEPKLIRYNCPDERVIADYLQQSCLACVFENEQNRLPFIDLDPGVQHSGE